MTELKLPALSLVVLIGPSGSGKSTFARAHFKPTEVLSSDWFRALVRDDENDLAGTSDAFEALHFVARKRLAAGLLTVVDATNVQPEVRAPLVALAREFHAIPAAIVLDVPMRLCLARNELRPDRQSSFHYVKKQHGDLRRGLRRNKVMSLKREGFRNAYVLDGEAEIAAATIRRERLWPDKRDDRGPFDLVGDVHGCADELHALLGELGYVADDAAGFRHPEGRRIVFLGDLVDRGPRNLDVLRLAMRMTAAGTALCVPGNHDVKFLKWLQGRQVKPTHGLALTIAEVEALPPDERAAFRAEAETFLDGLVSHLVFDGGRLVAAHAGMKASMAGRASGAVREFALYGDTTGEIDEFGLPVRYDWATEYRGDAVVVYGHTPAPEAEWLNKTICIDTGCVFGGKLTALRYPELQLVAVPAQRTWYEPARPLAPPPAAAGARTAQQAHDDVLDLADFTGKRIVTTRLIPNVTIAADQAAAALEAASRFAVDPRWLVYVPPTMSPAATSKRDGHLEHPDEAFAYYRDEGVVRVVCEEKHMGSRAVAVVARDEGAARRRFGVEDGGCGVVTTRTGRPFFGDDALQRAFVERLRAALTEARLWTKLETDWVVLDAELMPWSAKAQELLRRQYAPVGTAAAAASAEAVQSLRAAASLDPELAPLRDRFAAVAADADAFIAAWRRYCWPVASLADWRFAPFHLLASEGRVHVGETHEWHLNVLAELAAADSPWLVATRWRAVDLEEERSVAGAIAWWDDLTASGGEGMVVKPWTFVAHGRGLVQPAIKSRGREYLRIVYGPTYLQPHHLERLRSRGLGKKRQLAAREFALGIEGLERFVRGEPLRRVHECALGVLALESESVDPRL